MVLGLLAFQRISAIVHFQASLPVKTRPRTKDLDSNHL